MNELEIEKYLLKYGFSEEKIRRKLKGEMLISDELGCWFLERELIPNCSFGVKQIQSKFLNASKDATNYFGWEDDVVLDFYFSNMDSDVIKDYRENTNTQDILINVLYELYRIPFLESLIVRFMTCFIHPFYIQNLEVISNIFSSSFSSLMKQELILSKETNIDVKQVILLTAKYFDTLDASGELKNTFLREINSQNILLWDSKDECRKKEIQDKYKINDEYIMDAFMRLVEKGEYFINIPLSGTLKDVFVLVHEFFHYYSNENLNYFTCNYLFKELPSIYFETNLINFLEKEGFEKEEVLAAYKYRTYNHLFLCSTILNLNNFIRKMRDGEKIRLEDFECDFSETIKLMKCDKKVDGNLIELLEELQKMQQEKLKVAKERCDMLINELMYNVISVTDFYNYLFAKVLSDYMLFNSNDNVYLMFNFSKEMFSLEMDPYDILSVILPSSLLLLFKPIYIGNGIKRIPILKHSKK